MKGLLTKDFALFLQRKRLFIFLVAWSIIMCITIGEGNFVIGWMTVISSFFAISSLSFDEYDNCYPFLMSLPINGKKYVQEKYLFGFICGLGAWVFAILIYAVFSIVRGNIDTLVSEMVQLLLFIPVFMLLIDINLPINIKFGSERSRTIILIFGGVVFVAYYVVIKLLNVTFSFEKINTNGLMLVGVSFALVIFLTAISTVLSIYYMGKKEF